MSSGKNCLSADDFDKLRRDNRRALKLCKRVLNSGRPKQFFNEVKMDEE